MQPAFSGLPFFVDPVRDMSRAKAFYGGVLGPTPRESWEDQWVEHDVGAASLAPSVLMDGAQPGAAALETAQFDEAFGHLKAHGVTFLFGPVDTGVCKFARFEDSEGNHLVLHQKHAAVRP
jgi:predicted enzyme related to lactoylglutathione lyase